MAIKVIGNGFKSIWWVVATFCPSMGPYRAMATPFASNYVLISTERLLFLQKVGSKEVVIFWGIERKCFYQNDRGDRVVISWFHRKIMFTSVITSRMCIFCRYPSFSISFVINSFHKELVFACRIQAVGWMY